MGCLKKDDWGRGVWVCVCRRGRIGGLIPLCVSDQIALGWFVRWLCSSGLVWSGRLTEVSSRLGGRTDGYVGILQKEGSV